MSATRATREAELLAAELLRGAAIPHKAAIDAAHVAIATIHGVDVLLTWNCTHIANGLVRRRIEAICRVAGYAPVVFCTPLEITG